MTAVIITGAGSRVSQKKYLKREAMAWTFLACAAGTSQEPASDPRNSPSLAGRWQANGSPAFPHQAQPRGHVRRGQHLRA